jgi:hypothetical protein
MKHRFTAYVKLEYELMHTSKEDEDIAKVNAIGDFEDFYDAEINNPRALNNTQIKIVGLEITSVL